jgi:hypothetical protein
MGQLDLSARESPLNVEIQPDQRKSNGYRLALFVRKLRGERVDNMLMNECGIPEGKRIGTQFVERLLDGLDTWIHRLRTLG